MSWSSLPFADCQPRRSATQASPLNLAPNCGSQMALSAGGAWGRRQPCVGHPGFLQRLPTAPRVLLSQVPSRLCLACEIVMQLSFCPVSWLFKLHLLHPCLTSSGCSCCFSALIGRRYPSNGIKVTKYIRTSENHRMLYLHGMQGISLTTCSNFLILSRLEDHFQGRTPHCIVEWILTLLPVCCRAALELM